MLASGSPRRRELLAELDVRFRVVVPDVDERPGPGESAAALVARLAAAKAEAVASTQPPGTVVLAADTVAAVDGAVLGKPV
ncbi:MAG: maf protein, partial [Acidimicrobiales bacterium]|nr:maf protein [Acidimicrobiales bacterium]